MKQPTTLTLACGLLLFSSLPLSAQSTPDPNPAIECLSPELAPPIIATDAIERKAGVRLVDAARIRVPITASDWQHF